MTTYSASLAPLTEHQIVDEFAHVLRGELDAEAMEKIEALGKELEERGPMTNREKAIEDVAKAINIHGVTCFDGYFNERENELFEYAATQRELVYDLRELNQRRILALESVEWIMVNGRTQCPSCLSSQDVGHSVLCVLDEALRPTAEKLKIRETENAMYKAAADCTTRLAL